MTTFKLTDIHGYSTTFKVASDTAVIVEDFYNGGSLGWPHTMTTEAARKRYVALKKEHDFESAS